MDGWMDNNNNNNNNNNKITKSLQMPQAPWALERFSTANGCSVCGQCLNNLYLWLIKNCFRLLWQLICGVPSGLRGVPM